MQMTVYTQMICLMLNDKGTADELVYSSYLVY